MKSYIVAITLSASIGALFGANITAGHFDKKIDKIKAAQEAASREQSKIFGQSAVEWQNTLQAANNRVADSIAAASDVVPERVYIKTVCPVRPANTSKVANETIAIRVELAPESAKSLERVTKTKLDVEYRECSHILRSFQDAAIRNNWKIE